MSTIHNEAKKGDIADIVLMPGDPLRAKYIAENFLENVICFNQIRGMYGYTGTYKGKRISVMGHGMGIPSVAIYCYELYKFYDVKKIIRIGSCGAYDKNLDIFDTILVDSAYSFSNFASEFCMSDKHICSSSKELTEMIANTAAEKNIKIARGTVLTAEVFDNYIECDKKLFYRVPKDINCIAEEMESYALFIIAEKLHKEAACLLTVTDSIYKTQIISAENRQVALNDMIILALDTAIK